jgi:hypothetical protein
MNHYERFHGSPQSTYCLYDKRNSASVDIEEYRVVIKSYIHLERRPHNLPQHVFV